MALIPIPCLQGKLTGLPHGPDLIPSGFMDTSKSTLSVSGWLYPSKLFEKEAPW